MNGVFVVNSTFSENQNVKRSSKEIAMANQNSNSTFRSSLSRRRSTTLNQSIPSTDRVVVHKICELKAGNENYFVIGRVLSKSVITVFGNSRTFSAVISDITGNIRVTVWSAELCNIFYSKFEVDSIISLSKFDVRNAKSLKYTWVKNRITIVLNLSSIVIPPCESHVADIPAVSLCLKAFNQCTVPGEIYDLTGLVYEIGPEIIVKSERRSTKREIRLLDIEDKMVIITMWGETADNFIKKVEQMEDDVIVAFGGVQLSTFPRVSSEIITYLDSFDDSIILLNPTGYSECQALRDWLLNESQQ